MPAAQTIVIDTPQSGVVDLSGIPATDLFPHVFSIGNAQGAELKARLSLSFNNLAF